ncbi:cold shock domain-containing protein [Lachnospiraceae bacterium 48-42]
MESNLSETKKKKKTWKPRPRYMGTVTKWFNDRKYGFIECFSDGESYFAHASQLTDDYELVRGSIVEFEIWHNKENPDNAYAAKILICEVPEKSRKRKY